MSRVKAERTESTTVTVRVDEDLREDYTGVLDESVGDDIRPCMKEVARTVQDKSDSDLLDDEILRDGYLAFRQTTEAYDPNSRRIDVTTAILKVAEQAGVPKDAVRRYVLRLLIQDGYAELDWGETIIYRPEEVDASTNRVSPTKGRGTNS